jgi:hypothetical protein
MNAIHNAAYHNARWLLVGVTLAAFLLRLWGINFGLPYLYHPDEPGYVTIAQNIFKTGDLNPHFFNYPSLFFYLNALAYMPYYLAGRLAGAFSSPADIAAPPRCSSADRGRHCCPAHSCLAAG